MRYTTDRPGDAVEGRAMNTEIVMAWGGCCWGEADLDGGHFRDQARIGSNSHAPKIPDDHQHHQAAVR